MTAPGSPRTGPVLVERALPGRERTLVARKNADPGWHWVSWACEYVGTAVLLLGGLSAVFLDFGAGSPVTRLLPSTSAQLLLTGAVFAGNGSLVAVGPLGRRSGAHLNPAVTLAFWTQGKVHRHDLAGYIAAQTAGAITAAAVLRVLWGRTAQQLDLGTTEPGRGINGLTAAALEAVMTAALILMIFFFTSHPRTARWTPLGTWILVATLVWQGAPYTGTSLNPARSTGPALLAPDLTHLWVYFLGPTTGAVLAAAVFAVFRDTHVLTAKLFHDPSYLSTLASDLPTTHSTTRSLRRSSPAAPQPRSPAAPGR